MSKQCGKCGKFIQDSLMPWCDECLRRNRFPEVRRANPKAPRHWEEGYEPPPAA